jgi:hypothetical protein
MGFFFPFIIFPFHYEHSRTCILYDGSHESAIDRNQWGKACCRQSACSQGTFSCQSMGCR